MGSKNSGNFLNPSNLIPAVLTGGLSYGIKEFGANMKPPQQPNQPPPPTLDPAAIPHAFDGNSAETAAARQKKLAALQYGFASTMTNKTNTASSLMAPMASGMKAKTGQ